VTEADATGSPAHPEQGRADAKVRLRHELLERRRALTPEQIATARRAVAAQVLTRAARDGWRTVAAYEPFRTEPGSVDLLTGLRDLDITVLVPVLLPDRDLDWRVWPDGAPLGVDAVRRCDALLLPALAVAPSGARLGRGGGSYDRVLGRRPTGAPTIALLHVGEVVPTVPTDEWDVPIDEAVSPDGWIVVSST
jgi:5-formyltetrahydrofolate cyclo-ligase